MAFDACDGKGSMLFAKMLPERPKILPSNRWRVILVLIHDLFVLLRRPLMFVRLDSETANLGVVFMNDTRHNPLTPLQIRWPASILLHTLAVFQRVRRHLGDVVVRLSLASSGYLSRSPVNIAPRQSVLEHCVHLLFL